jgi:hypothetical protein
MRKIEFDLDTYDDNPVNGTIEAEGGKVNFEIGTFHATFTSVDGVKHLGFLVRQAANNMHLGEYDRRSQKGADRRK